MCSWVIPQLVKCTHVRYLWQCSFCRYYIVNQFKCNHRDKLFFRLKVICCKFRTIGSCCWWCRSHCYTIECQIQAVHKGSPSSYRDQKCNRREIGFISRCWLDRGFTWLWGMVFWQRYTKYRWRIWRRTSKKGTRTTWRLLPTQLRMFRVNDTMHNNSCTVWRRI